MMRCKKCDQASARVVTKRELRKLSKTVFSGPLIATAAKVASATAPLAAAATGPVAVGLLATAVKGATKGPKELLIGAGITAAVTTIGIAVKHGFSKLANGDKTYAYCSNCGHYEPLS